MNYLHTICLLLGLLCTSILAPAQTTFFQPIGTDSNGGDELIVDGNQWDAVTPGGLQVVCLVTPLPPKITLFGTTKTGTVSGLTGSVQNTSSNLQIDQVYKGSATATFVYSGSVGGTKIPCGQVTGAIVTLFFSNLEVEIAQSFVLNAGGGPAALESNSVLH